MDQGQYSEKEVLIFNGLIHLLKKGENPYQIKVADIANAAGVGKGTIYDYFANKEEVIKKALIYNLHREITLLEERVQGQLDFKAQFYEILAAVCENIQNEFSTFNIMLSVGKNLDLHRCPSAKDFSKAEHPQRVEKLLEAILKTGYQEGIIKNNRNPVYAHMVIKSATYMFGEYMKLQSSVYKDITKDQAMDYAYQIVLKSLNE